jgi:diadenosine tetraphosphate (Ap4A) HIT family hydrolase
MLIYDSQNIFAKILRNEIPCKKVYENEGALAFDDIAPHAPVHVLVIPKSNYISSEDFLIKASSQEKEFFWSAVSEVIKLKNLGTQQENNGYRLITNTGHDGSQEVPHFHIHILGGKKLGGLIGH